MKFCKIISLIGILTAAAGAAWGSSVPDLQWLRLPVAGPMPLNDTAIAFDSRRDRVVIYGGITAAIGQQVRTWEFDRRQWSELVRGSSDMPGRDRPMIYDSARGLCVVAIGVKSFVYDGQSWRVEPNISVPPRSWGAAMVYDAAANRAFFHGGFGSLDSLDALSDFHQRNGDSPWIRLAIETIPPRGSHAMIYDPSRKRIVIFGGESWSRVFGDTWEWDGTNWTQIVTPQSPAKRFRTEMAYHEDLGGTILFGGGDYSSDPVNPRCYGDTWFYDGVSWTKLLDTGPTPRFSHAMVFDSIRRRIVLYGGFGPGGVGGPVSGNFDDTWVLVPACKANCNADATADGRHRLDIQDFSCFQNAFALGDLTKADCNGDGGLGIQDFTCFQNAFALGCP